MISVHIAFLILIIHCSNVVHGHGKVRFSECLIMCLVLIMLMQTQCEQTVYYI